jgi:hypothetical protein
LRRILLAFRGFFSILFRGSLSDEALSQLGLSRRAQPGPASVSPAARPSDGALQILAILQRDSRLIDFIMEDVSAYSDEQIGAAVRSLHDQCRESLTRYLKLQPVIDGVEGTFARPPAADPGVVKFVGNVPAGTPDGGVLRHKGWRAARIELPPLNTKQDLTIIAPAELEIE